VRNNGREKERERVGKGRSKYKWEEKEKVVEFPMEKRLRERDNVKEEEIKRMLR
jgi:hypothetical protein